MKVFDLVAARTGLREHEASTAGFSPVSSTATCDDHNAYYPGAQPISIRITGDADTGKLLGAQLIGTRGTETAKRVDTYAVALFHGMTVDGMSELDLSYTPPLGSPWDAVKIAAQTWTREHRQPHLLAGQPRCTLKPPRGHTHTHGAWGVRPCSVKDPLPEPRKSVQAATTVPG